MTSTTTMQYVFDAVATHFLSMDKQAANAYGECFYRSPEGSRCFVGALIKDEYYKPDLEGKSLCHVSERAKPVQLAVLQSLADDVPELAGIKHMPTNMLDMLGDLQQAHDNWKHPADKERIKAEIIRCSKEFNVSPHILEAA